jgi:hypothetical protein
LKNLNKNSKEKLKMDKIDELNGSELGTIQYWEKNYEMEIKNYVSFKDPGEVW